MGIKQFLEIIKPGGPPISAADLAAAVQAVEAEHSASSVKVAELTEARRSALILGQDRDLDAIERNLALAQREFDRADLRLPELRRRHAEQAKQERAAADLNAFDKVVRRRLDAAASLDAALTALGAAHRAYEASGAELGAMGAVHHAERCGNAVLAIGGTERETVTGQIFTHAPGLGNVLRLVDPRQFSADAVAPIAEVEHRFWARVRARFAPSTPAGEA